MGTSAAAAAPSSGVVGAKPGLVTTNAKPEICCAAVDVVMVATPLLAYPRRVAGSSSHRVAAAPNRLKDASTALPVTPPPATSTGAPGTRGPSSDTSGTDRGQPLTVEKGHAQTAGDRSEQPKANDHSRFGPPTQLEMVMEGRHPEHPAPSGAESQDLQHNRADFGDEQRTQHDREDLGAAGDRQARNDAAQRQRPGVTHEDLGGRGIPPQKTDAGASGGGRNERQVQRVAHVVAAQARRGRARVAG